MHFKSGLQVQHRTRPGSAPWSRRRFKSRRDTTAPGRTLFSNVSTFIREVDHLMEVKLVSNISHPWSWACIVAGLSWIIARTRCDWF